jgi:hypothetical protein
VARNGLLQYVGCRHRGVLVVPGASVAQCLECNSEVDIATLERLWCLFDWDGDISAGDRAGSVDGKAGTALRRAFISVP